MIQTRPLLELGEEDATFSRSPSNPDELLVEGVWGLNQGMVDGTVPPHRRHMERNGGQLNQAVSTEQIQALRPTATDVRLVDLPPAERSTAPRRSRQIS